METKQTALQWLLEQWPILESQIPPAIINNALQMEREQIEDSFRYGVDVDLFNGNSLCQTAQQYYNETYGGKDE